MSLTRLLLLRSVRPPRLGLFPFRRAVRPRRLYPLRTILWLEELHERTLPATYNVTSLLDTTAAGTFRWAVTQANATTGPDTITFGVAGTINVTSALPTITEGVVIDGWTAPGFSSGPVVRLNGAGAGTADGLTVATDHSVIRGLAIDQFTGNQIRVTGAVAVGNMIAGNYIGVGLTGTGLSVTGWTGIQVDGGATGTVIGTNGDGTNDAAERNVINGFKTAGIVITGTGTNGTVVAGNYYGLSASGTINTLSGSAGVLVTAGAAGTRIGTDGNGAADADERNVIAATNNDAILVSGSGTDGTVIAGNYIGTNAAGTTASAFASGGVRVVAGAVGTRIGTDGSDDAFNADERNVIATGVAVQGIGTASTVIAGNYIGLDATGTISFANGTGVQVSGGVTGTRIGTDGNGTADADERNVIVAPNGRADTDGRVYAIFVSGSGTDGTVVAGNYIGSNAAGTSLNSLNGGSGILVNSGASGTRIGTDGSNDAFNANERNVISGNSGVGGNGIKVDGVGTANTVIAGNYIGTNAAGTDVVGANFGVQVSGGATGTRIGTDGNGTADADERNVIITTRLTSADVLVTGMGTDGTVIAGNYIGTNAAGTAKLGTSQVAGVSVAAGATNTRIGTDGSNDAFNADERNVISDGTYGILLDGAGTSGTVIAGDYIGTDAAGTAKLGIGTGIRLQNGVSDTRIGTNGDGTADADERNVISGAGGDGILVFGSTTVPIGNTVIAGNYIGTDATGALRIGNGGIGIHIEYATNTRIGTDGSADAFNADERNVISGNIGGIAVEGTVGGGGPGNAGIIIAGNYIGTNAAGTAALGNGGAGVSISGASDIRIGTDGDGTADAAERNVISGNTGVSGYGVRISYSAGAVDPGTVIAGNYIGTDAAGTIAIGNGLAGVYVVSPSKLRIGTAGKGTPATDAAERNVISGNGGAGIFVDGGTGTVIAGNDIGTNAAGTAALGNAGDGIQLEWGTGTRIGTDGDGVNDTDERNIISGNGGGGVWADAGTTGTVIAGNYIGTNGSGTAAVPNLRNGVTIYQSKDNRIGGDADAERNIISGNGVRGVLIVGSDTTGNVVQNNYIGTDVTGMASLGNSYSAIFIGDAAYSPTGGNTGLTGVASDTTVRDNVLSGNTERGVWIRGVGADRNLVVGNFIGTNRDGTAALPNSQHGIRIDGGASDNVIGGRTAAERNVISGNAQFGVLLVNTNTTGNRVIGNYIGTDGTGLSAIPNGLSGVEFLFAAGNYLGTDGDGTGDENEGNLISGNQGNGVVVTSVGSDGNVVAGNRIGTDATGLAPLPNGGAGVLVSAGATNTRIGTDGNGTADDKERNIISGNTGDGIQVSDAGTTGTIIAGNLIGADATGLAPLPNGGVNGILVSNGAASTRIGTDGNGTADDKERNVIARSATIGIQVSGAGTTGTAIAGNFIGTDVTGTAVFGNSTGVSISGGASGNTVGGQSSVFANRIRGFTVAGVQVRDNSVNNTVLGNSIVGAGGLAIELGTSGLVANDPGDADTGPNNLQNAPVLTAATIAGGTVQIAGTLNSRPNQRYRIELFADAVDSPGNPQADAFLQSADVTTDAAGNAAISFTFPSSTLPGAAYRYFAASATQLADLVPVGGVPDGTSTLSLYVAPVVGYVPAVTALGPFSTNENGTVAVPFGLADPNDDGKDYTATVSVTHGVLVVTGAGVAVGGSGTAAVTLTGSLTAIRNLLAGGGLSFEPTDYYSGDASVALHLQSPGTESASATAAASVFPVASVPVPATPPAGGTEGAPIPVPIGVSGLVDTDGSETLTVTITDPSGAVAGFTDGAGNPVGVPAGPDRWQFTAATTSSLLALLADLRVVTAAGFTGTILLGVTASVHDTAVIGGAPVFDNVTASGTLPVAVALDAAPTIALAPIGTILEGQPWAVAVAVGDPDGGPTDPYRVVLTTPAGVWVGPDPAAFAAGGVTLTGVNTNTLTATGPLAAIRSLLTVMSARDDADPYFSGHIPGFTGTVTSLLDGQTASATAAVRVLPVAAHLGLSGATPTATPRATPASLTVTLDPATGDPDETTAVYVTGLPAGAALSAGAPVPVGQAHAGEWKLARTDLAGLRVVPPAAFIGDFTLRFVAVTTDPDPADPAAPSVFTSSPLDVLVRVGSGSAAVAIGPLAGAEGDAIPLAAAVTLTDPDALPGDTHTAVFHIDRGTLRYASSPPAGVTAAIDPAGQTLTASGDLTLLRGWLAVGGLEYEYAPTDAHYSGEVRFDVRLTNDTLAGDGVGSAVRVVPVRPVAEAAAGPGVTAGMQSGATIPLTITLPAIADTDGSEAITRVEVAGLPPGVRLSAGADTGGGGWEVPTSDLPGLALLFDGSGFRGRFTLTFRAVTADVAKYPTLGTAATDTAVGFPTALDVRYFAGGIGAKTADRTGAEGAGTDLAGAVAVADPDALAGDVHQVTLTVSAGRLGVDAAAVPAGVIAAGDGTTAVTLTGALAAINALLAAPGGLRYDAGAPSFAGGVPVSVAVRNTASPLAPWVGGFGIRIAPVASLLVPTAPDAATDEETPVPLAITVPPTPDADGSETVAVLVRGVPVGATLNRGTDLGGGTWRVPVTQLVGLTLTPPPLFAGTIALTAAAVVTDAVTYAPLTGTGTDVRESAPVPFAVTVRLLPTDVTFAGGTVAENSPTGTWVGRFLVAGGHPGEAFTVRSAASTGYDFTVDPDGTVRVGTQVPDYETLNAFDLTVDVIGSRGARLTSTAPITVTNVNEAPVIAGGSVSGVEDTPSAVTGVAVSDPDIGTGPMRLRITVSHGTLTVVAGAGVSVANNGTDSVVLDGSPADINAVLAAVGGVTYYPTPDSSGVDTLTVTADDLGGTGAGGPIVTRHVVPFLVAPVADVPDLTVVDAVGAEDAVVPLFISGGVTDRDGSESMTVTIRGVPPGGALTAGLDLGDGAWRLTVAELVGLGFVPPSHTAGAYDFAVEAAVVDVAPGTDLRDTTTRPAALRVSVRAAANPPPAAAPSPPPVPSPPQSPPAPVSAPAGPTASVAPLATGSPPAPETAPPPGSAPKPLVELRVVGPAPFAFAGGQKDAGPPESGVTLGATLVSHEVVGETRDGRDADTDRLGPHAFAPTSGAYPTATAAALTALGDQPPRLPPVRLDPTVPQAGFSESYGESFELFDRLARERVAAAAEPPPRPAPPPAPAGPPAPVAGAAAAPRPGPVAGPRTDRTALWVVVVGLATASGVTLYRPARLARIIRSLRRWLARRPTARTILDCHESE